MTWSFTIVWKCYIGKSFKPIINQFTEPSLYLLFFFLQSWQLQGRREIWICPNVLRADVWIFGSSNSDSFVSEGLAKDNRCNNGRPFEANPGGFSDKCDASAANCVLGFAKDLFIRVVTTVVMTVSADLILNTVRKTETWPPARAAMVVARASRDSRGSSSPATAPQHLCTLCTSCTVCTGCAGCTGCTDTLLLRIPLRWSGWNSSLWRSVASWCSRQSADAHPHSQPFYCPQCVFQSVLSPNSLCPLCVLNFLRPHWIHPSLPSVLRSSRRRPFLWTTTNPTQRVANPNSGPYSGSDDNPNNESLEFLLLLS